MDDEAAVITENFSEKPKRGRPAIDGIYAHFMKMRHSDRCRRTVVNNVYWLIAMEVVRDDDRFSWLMELTPNRQFRRKTLLYELGRFVDPELIADVATLLCEYEPKVKDGVKFCQRLRSDKPTPERPHLLEVLHQAVLDYRDRYPETTDAAISDAAGSLSAIYDVLGSGRDD